MIKALFFDIDGTLVSFKTHKIPESTINAIKVAKDKGISIFISTGRPYSLINNINEISHLIDGYITVNGAYCFSGENIISSNPIPKEDVNTVIEMSNKLKFACMVVGENELVMYNSNEKVDFIFRKMLNVTNMKESNDISSLLEKPIFQLTPVISEDEEKQIMPLITGCMSSRWYPDFADITSLNANKGYGLISIINHFGIKKEETMAFGDGGNDISIIKEAGIGVAMGNANDELKSIADYTTSSVDEDGIFNALRNFNVI